MQRGKDRVFLGSYLPSGQGPSVLGMDPSSRPLDSLGLYGISGTQASDSQRFATTGNWISTEQKRDSFTHILLQEQGKLVFSIRDSAWAPSGENVFSSDYWEDNGRGPKSVGIPHYYLALNSLGFLPGYTPKSATEFVGKEINRLFPWGGSTGGDEKSLKVGDVYYLTDLVGSLPILVRLGLPDFDTGLVNQVEVVFVADFFFVLKTRALHFLDGIAIHGIFQDSTGEFWMFQEGYGSHETKERLFRRAIRTSAAASIAGDFGARAYLAADHFRAEVDHLRDTTVNYDAATLMWHQFARKSSEALKEATPTTRGFMP